MSHCPHLPLSAVMQASHAAINKYLLPVWGGAQQQTRHTPLLRSIEGTDRRRTDGRSTVSQTLLWQLWQCQ